MSPPTVLVVEDDPVLLRLLEVSLELEGFSVLLAHDGAEGLELARAGQPDLVITDSTMPVASGFELIAALDGDGATRDIPVVLLSADDLGAELPAGVDDHVTKPFEPLDLVHRVNALLHR